MVDRIFHSLPIQSLYSELGKDLILTDTEKHCIQRYFTHQLVLNRTAELRIHLTSNRTPLISSSSKGLHSQTYTQEFPFEPFTLITSTRNTKAANTRELRINVYSRIGTKDKESDTVLPFRVLSTQKRKSIIFYLTEKKPETIISWMQSSTATHYWFTGFRRTHWSVGLVQ